MSFTLIPLRTIREKTDLVTQVEGIPALQYGLGIRAC
jgi:hypothetical protein